MTIAELLEVLSAELERGRRVECGGCDCISDALGVHLIGDSVLQICVGGYTCPTNEHEARNPRVFENGH